MRLLLWNELLNRRNNYDSNYRSCIAGTWYHTDFERRHQVRGALRRLFYSPIRGLNSLYYGEKTIFQRRLIEMMDIIVFVLALMTANMLSCLIMYYVMMKLVMNKRFIKKYTKMMVQVAEEVQNEMLDL
jgi:hypothetical protein